MLICLWRLDLMDQRCTALFVAHFPHTQCAQMTAIMNRNSSRTSFVENYGLAHRALRVVRATIKKKKNDKYAYLLLLCEYKCEILLCVASSLIWIYTVPVQANGVSYVPVRIVVFANVFFSSSTFYSSIEYENVL